MHLLRERTRRRLAQFNRNTIENLFVNPIIAQFILVERAEDNELQYMYPKDMSFASLSLNYDRLPLIELLDILFEGRALMGRFQTHLLIKNELSAQLLGADGDVSRNENEVAWARKFVRKLDEVFLTPFLNDTERLMALSVDDFLRDINNQVGLSAVEQRSLQYARRRANLCSIQLRSNAGEIKFLPTRRWVAKSAAQPSP